MTVRIGVGIIGASPRRGWAKEAHLPALRALPEFDVRAVSTTRRDTAEEAARLTGANLWFDDHRALLSSREVDLVVVAVNVTRHRELVLGALAAGKDVFCEWPLGCNLQEASDLSVAARAAGVRTLIGLQGRFSPALTRVRELLADGYVGKIIGTSMKGCAPHAVWDGVLEPSYEFHADPANGATMLSIPTGHALDMLVSVLGEFSEVSARFIAGRGEFRRTRDGAMIKTAAKDTISISGILHESGGLVSVHYHGGTALGPDLVWEINGTEGDLLITAESGFANMAPLQVTGSRDRAPPTILFEDGEKDAASGVGGPAANVARLYRQFAADITEGQRLAPSFDVALQRHQLLDAIERADRYGLRQIAEAPTRISNDSAVTPSFLAITEVNRSRNVA
jgi:predicted dehydrogenase